MKGLFPFLPRISLRTKVILLIVLIQIVFIGVAIYTMVQGEHKLVERTAKEAYLRYASSVANALILHLRERDLDWIDYHLNKITQDEGVVFVVVYDNNGKLISSAGQSNKVEKSLLEAGFLNAREKYQPTIDEVIQHRGSFLHEKGHIFLTTTPVKDTDEFLGMVSLAFTTKELNRAVVDHSWRGFRLIILAAILSVIVAVLVDRKLKGVVTKLIYITGKMAEGDLSQKVDIHTGDELETLGISFNRMAEKLEVSRKKMERWVVELENKVAERTEEINKERQKLDRIVSSIGAGILLINRDLSLAWANEFFREKFALNIDSIAGEKCYRCIWGEEAICNSCTVLKTFKTRRIEKDKKILKIGAISRYYSITSTPLFDDQGNVVQVLELIQDETESKKMEAQLEHASKMAAIGEFAAGVAHEINNPLASVSAYAERLSSLIERDTLFPKDKKEKFLSYLEMIQDQTYRTKEITGGILDFARKKEGTKLHYMRLSDVVDKVLKLLEIPIKSQKVNVKTDLTPGIYCFSDEGQLEQVFLNLMKNALDAIDEYGEITIKTWQEKDSISASVKDNGLGIEQEEIQKIFNPFYTTKQQGKGTGLGLYISYGIMQGLGGTIEVDSLPGKGSTFTLNLPLTKQAEGLAQ